jgi:hypothetical protein
MPTVGEVIPPGVDVPGAGALVGSSRYEGGFLSILAKLVTGLDEVSCWTMAVLFVRAERKKAAGEPNVFRDDETSNAVPPTGQGAAALTQGTWHPMMEDGDLP